RSRRRPGRSRCARPAAGRAQPARSGRRRAARAYGWSGAWSAASQILAHLDPRAARRLSCRSAGIPPVMSKRALSRRQAVKVMASSAAAGALPRAAAEKRRAAFVQWDVFTRTALTGNPLAVFTDARGLSDDQMQALARETNLSETTFI